MKSAIVPAQITTVEDKIAGNLSLIQLLLLIIPLFGASIDYIIFPPNLNFALYKIIISILSAFIFCVLALRIKGRILLQWARVILLYNLRPKYYVFNKNDSNLRNNNQLNLAETKLENDGKINQTYESQLPRLQVADVVYLEQIISNPQANLTFKRSKKGGIDVLINEIK